MIAGKSLQSSISLVQGRDGSYQTPASRSSDKIRVSCLWCCTCDEVAEGALGVALIIDLHGQQAQRPTVDARLGSAHGLQRVVGLPRVGRPHVVHQLPLQRPGNRIPQVRLPQVQRLDGLTAAGTNTIVFPVHALIATGLDTRKDKCPDCQQLLPLRLGHPDGS